MSSRASIVLAAVAAGLLALTGAATAQQPAPQPLPKVTKANHPGRVIFEHQCAPCHGAGPGDDGSPMLPGTATLERKYKGARPGALELRDDLNGDIIRAFARNGLGAMPSFRKSELSDADIDAIAGYLKATAKLSKAK